MESESCKYCGMSGVHSPECPTQFKAAEEEISRKEVERMKSDLEKTEGETFDKYDEHGEWVGEKTVVAKYKVDKGAQRPRLEFAKEQVEEARGDMESDELEKEIAAVRAERAKMLDAELSRTGMGSVREYYQKSNLEKDALLRENTDLKYEIINKYQNKGIDFGMDIRDIGGSTPITIEPDMPAELKELCERLDSLREKLNELTTLRIAAQERLGLDRD